MGPFDIATGVVDKAVRQRSVAFLRDKKVRLPTFAELAEPDRIPASLRAALAGVGPDEADPRNLYRVHWYNDLARKGRAELPVHVELPPALTGVDARIIVVLGALFPLIAAHKVLAAYACLAPRLAAGQFDVTRQRAVWPSTGNYCRGGVAISRILGCRGVAVLPGGMSQERFDWLNRWVTTPEDIIRTPGTESNVKEIYDKTAELARDPGNEIFNQFAEFGNYLGHWRCTGPALEKVFAAAAGSSKGLRLAGFVSASGSSGTLAAGDYLKDRWGAKIAVVEAVECPTLLNNGYGEHNIQGIGDKHVPLIHNVMNSDVVIGVSDKATDGLNAVFNTPAGRALLAAKGVPDKVIALLRHFGLSSIANLLGAIKLAKLLQLERRRRRRHGGDGRRRALCERAEALPRRAIIAASSRRRRHPSSTALISGAPAPRICSKPTIATASASSISAISPGSSSRASRSRISTSASGRISGAGCMTSCRNGTR